jgi:hypothetical protein
MPTEEEKIEEIILYYVIKSKNITFRTLLSFLAKHMTARLRRDRIALILSSMATRDLIRVYKQDSLWRITPASKRQH